MSVEGVSISVPAAGLSVRVPALDFERARRRFAGGRAESAAGDVFAFEGSADLFGVYVWPLWVWRAFQLALTTGAGFEV